MGMLSDEERASVSPARLISTSVMVKVSATMTSIL